jgi:serine/threonine protein kinase
VSAAVLEALESIGDYTLLELLKPSGPGDLYRARDTRRGRTVVLRLLQAGEQADAPSRAAFVAGHQALTAFTHPNVTTVFDAGEADGRLFVVSEFVKGHALRAEIAGRPLPPRRAVDLAIQIADAIAEVHAAGFEPAGLSPESILVTERGHARIPLAALGARFGFDTGTPARLHEVRAPEVREGHAPDERSDVFVVGSLLFEMLAAHPVDANGQAPSVFNTLVPKELDAAALRATAQQPDYRYQSLVTMAAELRSIAAILWVREAAADVGAPAGSPVASLAVIAGGAVVLAALLWWWLR